jgi:adenosine deaminase
MRKNADTKPLMHDVTTAVGHCVLHHHFETRLRILAILGGGSSPSFGHIVGTPLFQSLSPIQRLIYLQKSIPVIDPIHCTARNFERVVEHLVRQMANDNMRHVDLFVNLRSTRWPLDLADMRAVFSEQLRPTGRTVRFVASIDLGDQEHIRRDLKYLENLHGIIVGVDLNLTVDPQIEGVRYAANAIGRLQRDGLLVTMHLGETTSNAFNREVLKLIIPNRIGHGIKLIEDDEIAACLRASDVCLDMCPTSNIILGVDNWVVSNPLRRAWAKGLKCTINTDDPLLLGTSIEREFLAVGLAPSEVTTVINTAIEQSQTPKPW